MKSAGHESRLTLCGCLLEKVDEQIERTLHLIGLVPANREDWSPAIADAWPVGILLGHLLDCVAGFCAALHAASPARLAGFADLRSLEVNHRCGADEAAQRIGEYRARVGEGFAAIDDEDLRRPIPTVFVKAGEPLLTLLLGNLEHLINHKHQLFTYLKLMGVDVRTEDLYRFRTER